MRPKDDVYSDKPVALVDLDGTLADFDAAMQSGMDSLASPGEPKWSSEDEATEPEHIRNRRRIIKSVPGFWLGLPEMKDGFAILQMAAGIGFQIMVLSKGPANNSMAWMEKIDWCRQRLLNAGFSPPAGYQGSNDNIFRNNPWRESIPHKITLTEDKGLVYGRVLIDDWPPYIERWLEWRPRGVVIMPARSWNQSFSHPQVLRFELGKSEDACWQRLTQAFARSGKEQVYVKDETK